MRERKEESIVAGHGKQKNKPSHVRYTQERRWLRNKLRRILRSNGPTKAEEFRRKHGL